MATGLIKNIELNLCISVNLAGKSWRQVALLKECDLYDERQAWEYRNGKHLSLRVSKTACLGINPTSVDNGPVVSFECMDNEIENLPSFPTHQLKISGKCAEKQGNK